MVTYITLLAQRWLLDRNETGHPDFRDDYTLYTSTAGRPALLNVVIDCVHYDLGHMIQHFCD